MISRKKANSPKSSIACSPKSGKNLKRGRVPIGSHRTDASRRKKANGELSTGLSGPSRATSRQTSTAPSPKIVVSGRRLRRATVQAESNRIPPSTQAITNTATKIALPAESLNARGLGNHDTHGRAAKRRTKAVEPVRSIEQTPSSDVLSRDHNLAPTIQPEPPNLDVLPQIRELHRQRQDFHGAEKKIGLQVKAIQRRLHAIDCKKDKHATCPGVYDISSPVIETILGSQKVLQKERKVRERAMEKLAERLPVWSWWEAIRGCGALGLAQIVAEAGAPLSDYANPAKLWKRFGVGLVGGERQRKVKDPDLAREMGYSPSRRSILHIIGDSLIKSNKGEWRELYLSRKEFERTKPACMRQMLTGFCKHPELPCCKDAHTHNRALRYVEKRLLRNLWREWRRVSPTKDQASHTIELSGQPFPASRPLSDVKTTRPVPDPSSGATTDSSSLKTETTTPRILSEVA